MIGISSIDVQAGPAPVGLRFQKLGHAPTFSFRAQNFRARARMEA
jgi:hypothetical protein